MPPLERAKMLKEIARVLRENAGELAMIDSADCGNPIAEMIMDATIAAAQIEFESASGIADGARTGLAKKEMVVLAGCKPARVGEIWPLP